MKILSYLVKQNHILSSTMCINQFLKCQNIFISPLINIIQPNIQWNSNVKLNIKVIFLILECVFTMAEHHKLEWFALCRCMTHTCSNYMDGTVPMIQTLITRFMGPTWGPSWADRAQVGPLLAPWTLLSGNSTNVNRIKKKHLVMEIIHKLINRVAFNEGH